jgi:UDPglucose 6-dehydrogenase
MRISVVGTGHVGLTTAVCFAHLGHEVLGVDEDQGKIEQITRGELPFMEPGLAEMLREQLGQGRLRFSTDVAEAARGQDVIFICVGTPTGPSGRPDLSQVQRVAQTLAEALDGYAVITEKSTVPVGTGASIRRVLEEAVHPDVSFDVASNPEFLQEGRAITDTLEPSRIVIGTGSTRAEAVLRELYAPIAEQTGCRLIATDIATAELVKHASNAFLATKISYINQVAEICEAADADVETVAEAMGLDDRIGPRFLSAGIGYGGACLPKDVQAFQYTAAQLGIDFPLLSEVDRVNRARRSDFFAKIVSALGSLNGKRIAVWGLAFKPNTDDLRDAPGIEVARYLLSHGASVVACDPAATAEARDLLPQAECTADPLEAVRGADCIAICTEWPQFADVNLSELRAVMAQAVIIDGRNMLDPATTRAAGFRYVSMGRRDGESNDNESARRGPKAMDRDR